MMKKVWLVLLAVVFVFGLALLGCGSSGGGGGGGGEGGEAFSFEGPFTKEIYNLGGGTAPTFDEATGLMTITSTGKTGSTTFYFKFADIGYTLNRSDTLIFTYYVNVKTPAAVLTAKNPSNWGDDFTGDSEWGVGKGREYVLGDPEKSNYEGTKVNGTYDAATKTGTFEVLMKYLPKNATGIGFQHNGYATFDNVEVALNSVYDLKITKIENKVGEEPVDPVIPAPGEDKEGYDGEKLTITVGDDTMDITVDVVKGYIYYSTDETSFLYEADPTSGGYGNEYPYFKVDFGTGKTLSDYKELKLTYQGVTGDVGWQDIFLYASEEEPTGRIELTASNTIGKYNYANNGKEPMDITFEIDPDSAKVSDITAQEVWFIVNIHSRANASATDPTPTSFIISDIEFVPADVASGEFEPVTSVEYTGKTLSFVGNKITITGRALPTTATHRVIVWSTTTPDASITSGELTSTTAGKVTLVATVANGTEIGTPYTQTFTDVVEFVALANIDSSKITKIDEYQAGQGNWSIDQKLPFKYFVIATVNGGTTGSSGSFGGVQIGIQGGGLTLEVRVTGNYTSIAHEANEVVYFILDLSCFDNYDDALDSTSWVQLYVNYGLNVLGTYQGFVVDDSVTSLTAPADKVDFGYQGTEDKEAITGYVCKTLPAELLTP